MARVKWYLPLYIAIVWSIVIATPDYLENILDFLFKYLVGYVILLVLFSLLEERSTNKDDGFSFTRMYYRRNNFRNRGKRRGN